MAIAKYTVWNYALLLDDVSGTGAGAEFDLTATTNMGKNPLQFLITSGGGYTIDVEVNLEEPANWVKTYWNTRGNADNDMTSVQLQMANNGVHVMPCGVKAAALRLNVTVLGGGGNITAYLVY